MNLLIGLVCPHAIGADGQQDRDGVHRGLAETLAGVQLTHGALDNRIGDGAGLGLVGAAGFVGIRDQDRAREDEEERRQWDELLDQIALFDTRRIAPGFLGAGGRGHTGG